MTAEYGDAAAPQGDGGGMTFAYLPSILWQRRWWLVIPSAVGLAGGIATAFLLPSQYQARATLLVESPQVQSELVGDQSSTNVIDRRIARIRQQVLSRPDLVELIENNNLYPQERKSEPLSEVIERMRAATSIRPVTADVASSDQGSNTIAFDLSFDYSDPQRAQVVAQDFVERLVKLDANQTAEQAAGRVEFLQEQATALAVQIGTVETEIRSLTSSNGAALANSGMMMLTTGGGYQAQIAQLQRDNAQLAAQLRQQASATERDPVVVGAETQLAAARATYSDSHPDVGLAEQRLAQAKRLAASNARRFDNSTALQSQISANNAAIAELSAAQSGDRARASAVLSAQARAPGINEKVSQLQAKANGLRENYQAVATRLLNARGAAKLGEQQRGERLSIIDPPVAPDRPTSPNRPLIVFMGAAMGIGLGLLLMLTLEFLRRPIRGSAALARITGAAPMAIIPTVGNEVDGKQATLARLWALALPGRARAAQK